ncbi:MAG: hypothetical protein U9Q21_03915 [Candidatus Auribacterota bacterium]|nr:hypothetical protein [Candidatus Auribacterota bacterium]
MRWRCKEIHLSKTGAQRGRKKGVYARFVLPEQDSSNYYAIFPVPEEKKHVKD